MPRIAPAGSDILKLFDLARIEIELVLRRADHARRCGEQC